MKRNDIIGLVVAIAAFAGVIAFILSKKIIITSQAIEATLLFVLVLVTIIYAKRTSEIADATKKQAEEMKEQRLSEARPYLLLRLNLGCDELLQWDAFQGKSAPEEFKVTIRNAGKGPAINLEASLWHSMKIHPSDTKGYLACDQEWEASISKLDVGVPREGEEVEGWLPELREHIKYDDPGVIAVKYKDIYKHTWVSYLYLERHIDVGAFVLEGEQNIVELKNNDS